MKTPSFSLLWRPAAFAGCVLAAAAIGSLPVAAQEVTLQSLLQSAAATHPVIAGARADIRAGESEVEAARRRRWPSVSVVAESDSVLGGRTSTSARTRTAQIEQTLYDFGRIDALISQATAGVSKSQIRVLYQREQLSLQIIAAWQQMLVVRERQRLAEQALEKLRGFEAQMARRVQAAASPQIDLELVVARTRQTEVDLASARSTLRVAIHRLEQLSGIPGLTARLGDVPAIGDIAVPPPMVRMFGTADLAQAASDSLTVQLAHGDVAIARAQMDAKLAERWPSAYVRATQPLGGGSGSSAANDPAVFIGLRYTPGAGFSTQAEAAAIGSRIASLEQTAEAARLEILETLNTDREEWLSAQPRIQALTGAVDGSQQVLDSYSRQFTAGRKTWLDLLNAVRELTQNQMSLADARASQLGSAYRLQLRLARDTFFP